MFEKIEVNGDGRHPIYDELTSVPDADGAAGDVAVELREVPARPGRNGTGSVPAAGGAGRSEVLAAIEKHAWLAPAAASKLGWRTLRGRRAGFSVRVMTTFVLVHGAWGGSWGFRLVRGPLREAGHEVFARP